MVSYLIFHNEHLFIYLRSSDDIFSSLWSIFTLDCLLTCRNFMYFQHKSNIYIFQHFLPVSGFPFDFLTLSLSKQNFSHLMKSNLSFSFQQRFFLPIFMISAFFVLTIFASQILRRYSFWFS